MARRPPARPPTPRRTTTRPDTRQAVFEAAAAAFSARGFDGVGVDDIAASARVNKAMIYYHFTDKLALYRHVVRDMLDRVGSAVTAIAASDDTPEDKIAAFVERFVQLSDDRPWFPTLMLREIAEGAPHLDLDTIGRLRAIFQAFARILAEGHAAGAFRPVHPVLAYASVVGPLIFNAARERVAAVPGRGHLPMFVEVPRADLVAHAQGAARRLLAAEPMNQAARPSRRSRRS